MKDSFKTLAQFNVNNTNYEYFSLKKLPEQSQVENLPYSLKILLENLLRHEDGKNITTDDIKGLINWQPTEKPKHEINFTPSRVILQDFTGVPAVVDLAAMRDAMQALGGSPQKINPLNPVELVIDHSIMVDHFGKSKAFDLNAELEYKRNIERYKFLHWGQQSFDNFKVVPPNTGIVHQVNLEYLARVVFSTKKDNKIFTYPDTLVGTDSHTTMINGLGVLGWGVGGIEAEAAMLGQAIPMLIPQVVGFKLTGKLPEGTTATDLVLRVVEVLRQTGVVGKFVEFFGEGLAHLPLADRATIANMAPEYGATCGIFPIDDETLRFLKVSGRDENQISMIKTYAQMQGLFRDANTKQARYTEVITLDLNTIVPSIAGPKRPQDRIELKAAHTAFKTTVDNLNKYADIKLDEKSITLNQGDVVIAAITSCTNTSNPDVMLAAGLVAKKAVEKGLNSKTWVKTSLAPGSKVVTDYLKDANLLKYLEQIGFNLVGYGCTTCIGNSGPLPTTIDNAISENDLTVCAVLSGNRNFEGRIHPKVKNSYLASPPLVVVYALAGNMNIDLYNSPIGNAKDGTPVYLKDIWPTTEEIKHQREAHIKAKMYQTRYSDVYKGDERWQNLPKSKSALFTWDDNSTYIKLPPFFKDLPKTPETISSIKNANVLALLGDSVTTDHISPAGVITPDSPAAKYLQENNIKPQDFNSYGSRRGNHEVMMRGTFSNVRLTNKLAEGKIGGYTKYLPDNEIMTIYDAAMKYQASSTPLIVLAGKEYGTGSSRDWAAKGTVLLGVKAVIAQSFERIHRSNLIGMGVLPLRFAANVSTESLNLTGAETFDIELSELAPQKMIKVIAHNSNKDKIEFETLLRIETEQELEYYKHGGILQYMLRQLA